MTAEEFSQAYQKGLPKVAALFNARGVREPLELAQAAWTRAWEKRGMLKDDALIQPWVVMIGWNILRTEIRKSRRAGEMQPLDFVDYPGGQPVTLAPAMVAQLRERLPSSDWRPLELTYLQGLDTKELNRTLKYEHLSTTRVRVLRSRRAARKLMGLSETIETPRKVGRSYT
jgi:DNA-directed RNA polymerase specialized sigma24 family protein